MYGSKNIFKNKNKPKNAVIILQSIILYMNKLLCLNPKKNRF